MGTALVICIGNIARGDDGVAHTVASHLRAAAPPIDAVVVDAVDLDVAMASDVAQADLLVLVDAERRAEPAVAVTPLLPGPASRATGHGVDAPALLSLAQTLYGHCPRAWLVSLAAPEMGHGEALSAVAQASARDAVAHVCALLSQSR